MSHGAPKQPPATGPAAIQISRRTALLGLAGITAIGIGGYWLTNGAPSDQGLSFTRPLRIPPLLQPQVVDGELVFELSAQQGESELIPGVRFATMGFNGAYLAPTIRAPSGSRVRLHVTNEMSVPTTAHWHGMILPASQDGTPHQTIAPGATWTAAWRIEQSSATLWYHPHPHGQTELQVGRGLAGLFLVDDPSEDSGLPNEYGADDIPLILQDVSVASGGTQAGTPTLSPIGRIGNEVIVNGTHHAQLRATTDLVRFRVLNASTARCYNLELSTGDPFYLVATDGGLISRPEPLTSLLVSPAERAEILVAVPPACDLVLRSAPYDLGMSGGDNIASGATDKLDILRITGKASPLTNRPLPVALIAATSPSVGLSTTTRHFSLENTTINSRAMDMTRVDTVVAPNVTETWMVMNTSNRAHNFHIHGTQFRVLTRDGHPPAINDSGGKDTVFLPPKSSVELLVPFSGFVDRQMPYMYHCHLLWHEDQGMMAQYAITETGSEEPTATSLEDRQHH